MNTDITNHKPVLEETDRRTTEEKIKDFADKARPHIQKLWTARWKILIFNGVVLFLTIIYLFFIAEPYYESTVVILPEYGSKSTSLGQLGNLAAMAGVKVGDNVPAEIYQNIITSETVLESVVYGRYLTQKDKDSLNLVQYFKVESDESLIDNFQNRKQFLHVYEDMVHNRIVTDIDRKNNILTVKVNMPEPKLSADVVNKIVESLDNYIKTKRKSYASEQRYYLEMRIEQIKDSLSKCEDELKYFAEQNRVIDHSPKLLLQQRRSIRDVEILQSVFIELNKQLELVKIDEIKNTPIINIKEKAREPISKKGPKRLVGTAITIFFSLLASVLFLIFMDITRVLLTNITISGFEKKRH